MRRLLIAATIALMAGTAGAATVAGVNLDDTITVNGQKLVLNGAGIRKKLFIKVYVGALYLPAKQSNPTSITAADTARRMVMAFVLDVSKGKIADAWQEGLEANTPGASNDVKNAIRTLSSWMEDMEKGGKIVITYAAGGATTVEVNGKVKGTLPGKGVHDAILNTWIGSKPGPGEDFKNAVLGRE